MFYMLWLKPSYANVSYGFKFVNQYVGSITIIKLIFKRNSLRNSPFGILTALADLLWVGISPNLPLSTSSFKDLSRSSKISLWDWMWISTAISVGFLWGWPLGFWLKVN